KQLDTLDPHHKSLIDAAYANDLRLYRHACALLQQRIDASQRHMPWCHVAILSSDAALITGYACFGGSDDPVTLVLYQGEKEIAQTDAVQYGTHTGRFVLPRDGHITFRFNVRALKDRSNLKGVVRSTGQVLEDELIF
ncbi:MAG: hypothetical protein JXX14_25980, partial [Deltaproteobacteria bacterium]|nr:hypothetical protein [Deltaproteobacteria bacterium]